MMERLVPNPSTWSKMTVAIDTALGAAGITLAVMWPVIESAAQGIAVIAGCAVLVIRALINLREYRNPKD